MNGLFSLTTLKHSLSNLYEQLGSTNRPLVGTIINLTTFAIGAGLYYLLDGIPSYLALAFGLLGLLGIIMWVIRQ